MKGIRMPTNLSINEDLLNEALKIGGFKTKKDTVNQALTEFIQRRKQKKILNLFGKIKYEEDYNYKLERNR
jgi:Arc/MetJ family transcription regulator